MHHNFKKLLAVLLSLVLLLSLLPTAAMAAALRRETETEEESHRAKETATTQTTDPLPETDPQIGKHMQGDVSLPSDEPLRAAGEDLYVPKRDSLPSSYDSRNYNIVTSVKNQAYGDCWAHAAMACCETYMIKNQIPVAANGVIGSAADTSLNLSENHHAYFAYTSPLDRLNMLPGKNTVTFGNNLFQYGGNGDISMYSLMRWEGPANEATSALAYKTNYDNTNAPTTSTIASTYAYNYNAGIVTSVIKIPTMNRDQVKQMIREYGAGDFTYYSSDSSALNSSNGAYFCNQDSVVNTSSYHGVDHAVTVVGWDDNYSKYNFNSTPSGNGAWIIKNSWGTSGRPNGGYYYISYYDTASYNSNTYFYTVEALDTYDNNYQYDGTTNFYNYTIIQPNGSVAQAFTANGTEILKAVALGTAQANVNYTLKIYTGGDDTAADPTTGATLATQQDGTLTYAGYQKIALEHPVQLTEGQRFVVLFKITNSSNTNLSVDMTTSYDPTGWKLSWTHTTDSKTAYVNASGSSWVNTTNFNLRIKAYTSNPAPNSDCTVTLIANHATTTQTVLEGASIHLPTELDVDDWAFYGWAAQRVDHVTLEALEEPCEVLSGDYTVTEDITLYALYADISDDDYWVYTTEFPAVTGYSLTTNGDVLVNSYIEVPQSLMTNDSGMYVTIDNGPHILLSSITTTPNANGYVKTGDGFKFPYTVSAKNMQDTVTIRLYQSNGTQVKLTNATDNYGGVTYSVQGYIAQVLADADAYNAAYPGITDLCKAMSAYGSYAQVQQNYTTSTGAAHNPATVDSATASAINAISTTSISAAATASTTTNNIDGLEFYGASLVMLSKMTLRFYFTYTGSATLTSGGIALGRNGDYYYVDVTGIAAKDFGNGQTVTVSDGTHTCTVSGYSVNRYVYKVLTASGIDSSMLNLAKAIAYYGIKAAAYHTNNG